MNKSWLLTACVLVVAVSASWRLAVAAEASIPAQPEEPKEQRDARMAWWREARFGMFIHWGVYSVPAGTYDGKQIDSIGEWIMNRGKIPVDVYAKYAEQFNPVKFNADEWVAIAKNAGMKYIVITSKHHDGFAMYHSKASPYNIYDATPFKRDPLAELAEACRKAGIKLGFYYSQAQDWHHPGGAAHGKGTSGGAAQEGHWDKAQDGDMDKYLDEIAIPQVREILSNYGEFPAVLWWDTPKDMTPERAARLFKVVQELRPQIIMNNRLGGGFKGDTETPEQFIPATGYPGRDWETCMTMNGTWGYKSYDDKWKSTEVLLKNLCDIASKGGNYLLNVGPTNEGLIPAPSVERLAEVGKWMNANGAAIYGTSASPFRKLTWGRCTQEDGKLNLLVFDWPADGKLVVPMTGKVTKAYLLSDPSKPLAAMAGENGVTVAVPAAAPDPIVSVVVAEVDGDVQPIAPDLTVHAEKDGSFKFDATEAEIVGDHAKLEETHIGYWTKASDYVQWKAAFTAPGSYTVQLTYACEPGSEGSEYEILVGTQKVAGTVAATESWRKFKTVPVGTLTIESPGAAVLQLKCVKKHGGGVMNLRTVTLKPAK